MERGTSFAFLPNGFNDQISSIRPHGGSTVPAFSDGDFRGVTMSYFEWVQDLQSFFWSEAEVNAKLESVMRRAFTEVHESARKHRTHMRTGAYCLAVGRVADATLVRGLFP